MFRILLLISFCAMPGVSLVIPVLLCRNHCQNCTTHDLDIELKCGSDGVTYLNACELECAQEHCDQSLKLAHNGLCSESEIKPTNDALPPTTTESLSTSSSPPLPHAQPFICDPYDNCDCTYDLLLTCGTDGQTYPNECALNCAKTCKSDLKVLHYGACY